jgi:hypothetical protein
LCICDRPFDRNAIDAIKQSSEQNKRQKNVLHDLRTKFADEKDTASHQNGEMIEPLSSIAITESVAHEFSLSPSG